MARLPIELAVQLEGQPEHSTGSAVAAVSADVQRLTVRLERNDRSLSTIVDNLTFIVDRTSHPLTNLLDFLADWGIGSGSVALEPQLKSLRSAF